MYESVILFILAKFRQILFTRSLIILIFFILTLFILIFFIMIFFILIFFRRFNLYTLLSFYSLIFILCYLSTVQSSYSIIFWQFNLYSVEHAVGGNKTTGSEWVLNDCCIFHHNTSTVLQSQGPDWTITGLGWALRVLQVEPNALSSLCNNSPPQTFFP